jgi:hypothetical protein
MPTRRARPKEPVPPKLPAELAPARLSTLADDGVYLSLEFGGGVEAGARAEDIDVERCRFDTARLAGAVLRRGELLRRRVPRLRPGETSRSSTGW